MEGLHTQHAFRAIGLEIRTSDEPVAEEEREYVVAVDPFVLALVDLDQRRKAEDTLDERLVPEQAVER